MHKQSSQPDDTAAQQQTDTARTQPSLPRQRAFVVQLYRDADIEHNVFSGRIEHLASGRASHFASVDELLAFMRAQLTRPP